MKTALAQPAPSLAPPPSRVPPTPLRVRLQAAGFTLLVLVALAVGFRTLPVAVSRPPPARPLAEVTMLPLVPVGEPQVQYFQQDLVHWLQLLHPTIMSIPTDLDPLFKDAPAGSTLPGVGVTSPVTSSQVSFSKVRQHDFERPYHGPQAPTDQVEQVPPPVYPLPALTRDLPPVADTLAADWLHRAPDLPAPSAPPVTPPPGVVITDLDGLAVPQVPPLATAQVLAATTTLTCHGPTVLAIAPEAAVVRVVLRVSCGNAALDQVAVDHLRRLVAQQAALAPPTTPDQREWLAAAHTLVVHWRYVPGMTDERKAAALLAPAAAWPHDDWPGDYHHAGD